MHKELIISIFAEESTKKFMLYPRCKKSFFFN
jgi:hypothetical protein